MSAFTAATGVSACTAVTAVSGCTGVTAVSAFTGLSAITDTEAIGVSAYTGATAAIAGAELPCIATAAAGESSHGSSDVEISYGS